MAVEDGEAEEVSSTLSQPPELQESKASKLNEYCKKIPSCMEKCISLATV